MDFITLHTLSKKYPEVRVRANAITAFKANDTGSKVWIAGDTYPFEVIETPSEVEHLIQVVEGLERIEKGVV